MSLILDALNRSQQDASPVPGLATQHPVEPVTEGGRWYLPWVALAVAVVLIAWLLVDRYRTPQVSPAELGAPVAELSRNIGSATASVTNELRSRAAEAEEKAKTGAVDQQLTGEAGIALEPKIAAAAETAAAETAAETKVANVVAKPSERAVSPVPNEETTLAEPATPAPVVENAAVAALYENRVPDEPVVTKSQARPQGAVAEKDAGEETIDIEKVLARVREEAENASLMEHPVPLLSTMSQHTKDDIPTLYYQKHDYSNELSGSSVVLNGKEVKVGGSPVSGMKVEEILPDSVVLNYRGTQFRLRALNSWVNL